MDPFYLYLVPLYLQSRKTDQVWASQRGKYRQHDIWERFPKLPYEIWTEKFLLAATRYCSETFPSNSSRRKKEIWKANTVKSTEWGKKNLRKSFLKINLFSFLSQVWADLSFSKLSWFPSSNQIVVHSFSVIVAYSHLALMSSLKSLGWVELLAPRSLSSLELSCWSVLKTALKDEIQLWEWAVKSSSLLLSYSYLVFLFNFFLYY